jgi:alpha-ketoglutaric semialdehyde dehydrogenase
MKITGEMLIGGASHRGPGKPAYGVNPATGSQLEPAFGAGGAEEVRRAVDLANAAFDTYRETSQESRAVFLETIASNIMDLGDALVERASAETGLPAARIQGERGRTVGQLQLFARTVREGSFLEARIDNALPDRKPLPRADLRLRHVPVGPVAVFGASNFPLAFSVAGGDTASALAAGCPVVVKAHLAHPGTSELVGRAVQSAVAGCGMPEGVFSMLFGPGGDIGAALVAHEYIKAVGFTGSRSGGTALMKIAAARACPIPVYAEMSSINPVFLLPGALRARGAEIGRGFAASLTLGAGQFCTNPGIVIALGDTDLAAFIEAATGALAGTAAATMLSPGIFRAYEGAVEKMAANGRVSVVGRGPDTLGPNQARAAFFEADAESFLADPTLSDEAFGPSSLLLRCRDLAQMQAVAEHLEGQLTATLQIGADDIPAARALLPVLERKAGRILVNGYPTGVEVCDAMVHGGPYPATADGRSTSVGSLAIRRFLRPVCYQDMPMELLPEALRDGNPLNLWRRVNGELGRG